MLKNYLKTSFRSFRKNRFYSSLNIAGLAIALATCMMIVLYVYDELSYDKFIRMPKGSIVLTTT